MRCPKCRGLGDVLDSRPTPQSVRRRRQCKKCQHRWTTFETTANIEGLVRGSVKRLKHIETELIGIGRALALIAWQVRPGIGSTRKQWLATRKSENRWSDEEKKVMRLHYQTLGRGAMAERLGKSKFAVQAMARVLGCQRPRTYRSKGHELSTTAGDA